MKNIIVTGVPRADAASVDRIAGYGVATVHEALGRTGLVGHAIRPIQNDVRVAGSAVTVLSWPGDNLMIHAAIEQCGPGDLLVVATTSPSTDGMFGELFATGLAHRGVRGLVTTAGVRDTSELRAMGFPVWSAAVNAQGTVKATAGAVNVPIVVGGAVVNPGDIVLADDDGVMIIPRADLEKALDASEAREQKEAATRAAFLQGELGLDRYKLRSVLDGLGVAYVAFGDSHGD